jgi:hypothetical protein
VFTAVASPIPRFVDTGTTTTIFNVAACRTILLFPYVTYAAGFDTGIAISATSLDAPVFATSPQGGNCSLYWYAGGALVNTTALAVAAGATNATLTSAAVSAGTSGYMIASCLFQYAHGFAFVSDVGASKLAMGYLALVIPDLSTRLPDPFPLAGAASGEQLAP